MVWGSGCQAWDSGPIGFRLRVLRFVRLSGLAALGLR